jgi:hypothetical protein
MRQGDRPPHAEPLITSADIEAHLRELYGVSVGRKPDLQGHRRGHGRRARLAATVLEGRLPARGTLLPGTVSELQQLGISVREVALDGGCNVAATNTALADLQPKQTFIAGRQQPTSKRAQRRLRRYRTGAEGRISHFKRRYGLDRSRLKGDDGRQI